MNINKRYQVFISSTFRDLEEERRMVMQAVLRHHCFPAGMELFVATNTNLWDYIKQIIDDSDFYVLIVAGKSGSTHPEKKISYTEMEYDYAVSKGKNILRFVHRNIENLPPDKRELGSEQELQRSFIKKLLNSSKGASLWDTQAELSNGVIAALHVEIQKGEAIGWVRGDEDGIRHVLTNARSTIQDLQSQISLQNLKCDVPAAEIADEDHLVFIPFKYVEERSSENENFGSTSDSSCLEIRLGNFYRTILPALRNGLYYYNFVNEVKDHIRTTMLAPDSSYYKVNEVIVDASKCSELWYHMIAVDIIEHDTNDSYKLSKFGNRLLMNLSVLRKDKPMPVIPTKEIPF